MRIVAIVAVALLVGGAVGFALGRDGGSNTTTTIERTTTVEPSSRADELREQFGIPTDEAACKEFGIPADLCP
ncbi:MAG: hypothetical protein ACJ76B_05070 [Solirubrobacterales bacterium]